MILPVVAYGHATLKKVAADIDESYPELNEFIQNMWETMYRSVGVGLAAPQVNRSIRLFVIDATPYAEEDERLKTFKKVFINAQIVEREGEAWDFNEGCLSVPGINEDVSRPEQVRIQYYDTDWNFHDEVYNGLAARIIQHEYDHLEGILFVDRLSPMRKMLLRKKLTEILKGTVKVDYRMIFANKKKGRK